MTQVLHKETATPALAKNLEPTAAGPSDTGKNRVFIVDDHTMFREGLRQLIEREAGLTVCGDAPDAPEALRGIRASQPDVVIVDISLAGASGLDLIKDIKSEFEDLPVLVVSMHDESLPSGRCALERWVTS
jgi:chemotaxis response regulator CheB